MTDLLRDLHAHLDSLPDMQDVSDFLTGVYQMQAIRRTAHASHALRSAREHGRAILAEALSGPKRKELET